MRVVAGKVAEMAVVSVIKVLTTGMRKTASYNLTHRSIRSSRPVARAFLLVALVLQRVAASVRGVVVPRFTVAMVNEFGTMRPPPGAVRSSFQNT